MLFELVAMGSSKKELLWDPSEGVIPSFIDSSNPFSSSTIIYSLLYDDPFIATYCLSLNYNLYFILFQYIFATISIQSH